MNAVRFPITVFTATYNRAHTLHRVYDSLCRQRGVEFEWLIVDDGSTDGTRELVADWRAAASFPIRYRWQPNGGQHRACNRGVRLAQGELFAMIDSDDACTDDALARLLAAWTAVPPAERARLAGVGAECCDEHGRRIGTPLPRGRAALRELTFRRRVRGQKWWVLRTDLLRRHPWAETPYKAPNPWLRIPDDRPLVLVPEPLRVFYQDAPEESLSRAKQSLRPAPVLHRARELLGEHLRYLPADPASFAVAAAHFVRCALHLGWSPARQCRDLRGLGARLLWLAALPVGLAMYLRDRRRRLTIRR